MKGNRYFALVCLLMLIILVGCGCKHEWQEASCQVPKTCSLCGETEGDPLGHDWQAADCETPKQCSRCEATEGEALGHDWQETGCLNPEICVRCQKTGTVVLKHDWLMADCTSPTRCQRCQLEITAPLGHVREGSCTDETTCVRCGELLEAVEHTWVDASCDVPKTCSACGETDGEALGHDVPTLSCGESADCARCGLTVVNQNHSWIEATCFVPRICKNCHAISGVRLRHTSETECERCGKHLIMGEAILGGAFQEHRNDYGWAGEGGVTFLESGRVNEAGGAVFVNAETGRIPDPRYDSEEENYKETEVSGTWYREGDQIFCRNLYGATVRLLGTYAVSVDEGHPLHIGVGPGPVKALHAWESDLSFGHMTSVDIDASAKAIYIYSAVTLSNVKIEYGEWDPEMTDFTVKQIALSPMELSAGDAIELHAFVGEVLPTIRLSYTYKGINYIGYLTESGEDGSIHFPLL